MIFCRYGSSFSKASQVSGDFSRSQRAMNSNGPAVILTSVTPLSPFLHASRLCPRLHPLRDERDEVSHHLDRRAHVLPFYRLGGGLGYAPLPAPKKQGGRGGGGAPWR